VEAPPPDVILDAAPVPPVDESDPAPALAAAAVTLRARAAPLFVLFVSFLN
jgi:hypothetical protein